MIAGDNKRYSVYNFWENGIELVGIADWWFKHKHESLYAVLLDMFRNGNST